MRQVRENIPRLLFRMPIYGPECLLNEFGGRLGLLWEAHANPAKEDMVVAPTQVTGEYQTESLDLAEKVERTRLSLHAANKKLRKVVRKVSRRVFSNPSDTFPAEVMAGNLWTGVWDCLDIGDGCVDQILSTITQYLTPECFWTLIQALYQGCAGNRIDDSMGHILMGNNKKPFEKLDSKKIQKAKRAILVNSGKPKRTASLQALLQRLVDAQRGIAAPNQGCKIGEISRKCHHRLESLLKFFWVLCLLEGQAVVAPDQVFVEPLTAIKNTPLPLLAHKIEEKREKNSQKIQKLLDLAEVRKKRSFSRNFSGLIDLAGQFSVDFRRVEQPQECLLPPREYQIEQTYFETRTSLDLLHFSTTHSLNHRIRLVKDSCQICNLEDSYDENKLVYCSVQ
jgi:hypothetical protein